MTKTPVSCIILAAGKGTRMKSALPKVMHQLAGKALILHVIDAAQKLSPQHIDIVINNDMDEVKDVVYAHDSRCRFSIQEEQLGTANAVSAAQDNLQDFSGHYLILYGDTPLITSETLQRMVNRLESADKPAVIVLGMQLDDPTGYGRLLLNDNGSLERIVECRDASAEEKAITLCNSGVMAIRKGLLFDMLAEIKNDNAKNEYYLTDIVAVARKRNLSCAAMEVPAEELMGINSRTQLAEAERIVQNRLRHAAMDNGVTLIAPETVFFAMDTSLGNDVVIHPNVVFGAGVAIENNVEIRSFSHIEGAIIAEGAVVGPFARLRPGAHLGEGVRIGNFVEIKKSTLEPGAKVSHLSYIGDADVGEGANIGAGTITCNYDGFEKHRTSIGKRAFIGSNTALVAPVTVGAGAVIGAGSVITEDVDEEELSLSRPTQKHMQEWAKKYRLRKTN